MVQNSLASSQFLLSSPRGEPPHKQDLWMVWFPSLMPSRRAELLSSAVPDRQRGKAALWSNHRLWLHGALRLEEHQMVKTSKGRNYEHSQKIQRMLCLAKLRPLKQLPEVHEITASGIQPKHQVRNKGCASWGGTKDLAAQLNRHLLVSDTKRLQMSSQTPP